MRRYIPFVISAVLAWALAYSTAVAGDDRAASDVERGRYIARIGGCNDCHTPNYAENAGNVPEDQWMTGVPVGFQGPWGTSYAANLRLVADRMDEEQFMARSRSPLLPPMPWFSVRDMADDDLRALYRYLRALGPAGSDAPAYVPPGGELHTPYIVFVPLVPQASSSGR